MNKEISGPLISVITPTYNHAHYIEACIQSVQGQTYTNWEMIIINDGSTDDTADHIQSYAAHDPRITVINQEHKGINRLSENYNTALARAGGSYVAILEGDDVWYPEKLMEQVKILTSHPEAVLIWSKAMANFNGHRFLHTPVYSGLIKSYFNDPPCSIFNIIFKVFTPPLTFLIKKEALLQIGGFHQVAPFPAVDLPTILALSRIGTFYFMDTVTGEWRQHSGQVTKSNQIDIIHGSQKIMIDFFDALSMEERKNIHVTRKEIIHFYKKAQIIAYSRSGRFKLLQKKFTAARRDYIVSLFKNGFRAPIWKLRSLVGLVFSLFHLDVEWLAKLLGRNYYK